MHDYDVKQTKNRSICKIQIENYFLIGRIINAFLSNPWWAIRKEKYWTDLSYNLHGHSPTT